VPYDYDAHSPQDPRELVTQFAGVGVLDVTP
jgi:pectate lyase